MPDRKPYSPPTVTTIDASKHPAITARIWADRVVDQELAAVLRALADRLDEAEKELDGLVDAGAIVRVPFEVSP